MSNEITIDLLDGKYQYHFDGGKQTITRHGEAWRDETGDSVLLAMAQRIQELEEELDEVITALDNQGIDLSEVL